LSKKGRQRRRAKKHKAATAALVGITPEQFDALPKAERAALHRRKHAIDAERVGSFGLADRLHEPVSADPEESERAP